MVEAVAQAWKESGAFPCNIKPLHDFFPHPIHAPCLPPHNERN